MSDADDWDWLHEIAAADRCELREAAAALVENGVTLSADDWRTLGTKGRAVLTVARRAAKVFDLEGQGRDLDAARSYSQIDGGTAAARLMARAAGEGVARALREAGNG